MAYSYTEYTAAGSITTATIYTAPPYLEGRGATDIKVTVDGSYKVQGFHYQLASTAVTFNAGYLPSNGQTIRITRSSSQATRLNDYADASLLTADTLDADANQLFFIAQEALDTASETNLAAATFYSSGTSAPSSATAGDLFFNTATGLLQIYTGSAWESVNNRGTKQTFAISTSTTVFTPSTPVDDNTLVFLNGVLLVKGSGSAGDYTTSSTQVTLNTAVSSGVVEVVTFPNATNNTFTGTITADGLTVDAGTSNTLSDIRSSTGFAQLSVKSTATGGSTDYGIIEVSGTDGGYIDIAKPDGTGYDLRIQHVDENNSVVVADTSNLIMQVQDTSRAVILKHGANSPKLTTTTTGIDVTGTVTASGGYKSSDGTAGFTGSASASATLTIKDGLIVAVS